MTPNREIRYPLLPGIYHVVPRGADRVQLRNAGRIFDVSGPGIGERLPPLLEAMDGKTSVEELRLRFPEGASEIVAALAERGLVVDCGAEEDRSIGASPWLASFAIMSTPSIDAVRRLQRSRVAIVGCGPVNATSSVLLGKAGVGEIVLCDDGRLLAASDVAAVPWFSEASIGQQRLEMVADACRAWSGVAYETVLGLITTDAISDADVVVVEGNGPDAGRATAADLALEVGAPYLVNTQDAFEAVVGPLVSPGGRPCHRCAAVRRMSHVENLPDDEAYLQLREATVRGPDATLAAHTVIAAGVVATEVMRAILRVEAGAASRALVMNLGDFESHSEEVLPVPGCAGCISATPHAVAPL